MITEKSIIDRATSSITFERTIGASPEDVFDAWTKPERISVWWDPTGAPLRRCEIDLRPGGAFRFENEEHGPPFAGVYRTIERPKSLVFEALGSTGSVELVAVGTSTKMRVSIRCASPEHLEQFLKVGVREGTDRTLDNLVAYLA